MSYPKKLCSCCYAVNNVNMSCHFIEKNKSKDKITKKFNYIHHRLILHKISSSNNTENKYLKTYFMFQQ